MGAGGLPAPGAPGTALARLADNVVAVKGAPRAALARFSLAGAMAGFACGVKLTAVPLLLILLPLIAVLTLRTRLVHAGFFILAGAVVFWNWLEDLVFSRFGDPCIALGHIRGACDRPRS
mgnify:CR=1 FL=1